MAIGLDSALGFDRLRFNWPIINPRLQICRVRQLHPHIFRHLVSADVPQRIDVRMVELDHIQIGPREDAGAGDDCAGLE